MDKVQNIFLNMLTEYSSLVGCGTLL